MGLVDHAEYELKNAGYTIREIKNIESDEDYSDSIANSVLELLKVFAAQGHSGMSAQFTLNLFNKLAKFENLTPLTDNKEEWNDITEQSGRTLYQSKRNSSCFSTDLKTYYDIDAEENREYEYENGEKTDWYCLKKEMVHKELVHV